MVNAKDSEVQQSVFEFTHQCDLRKYCLILLIQFIHVLNDTKRARGIVDSG